MVRLLPALLVLLPVLVACGEVAPCTTCRDVAGSYQLEADPVDANAYDCPDVYFSGGSGMVSIGQDGSVLTYDGWWQMKGTLFEDDTFSFEPAPYDSAVGTVRVMASGSFFDGEGGTRTASGNFLFSVVDYGCTVTAPMRLTLVQ